MSFLKKSIIAIFAFFAFLFLLFSLRSEISPEYKPFCMNDCIKKDMTRYLEGGDYTYILKSDRYNNFSLKYSDYASTGAFYLTANYKENKGKTARVKGMSFDNDKSQMDWPFIGDAAITYENGKIFMSGNDKIFNSVASEFANKLDDALRNMKNVSAMHNEELKPKVLLNGEER